MRKLTFLLVCIALNSMVQTFAQTVKSGWYGLAENCVACTGYVTFMCKDSNVKVIVNNQERFGSSYNYLAGSIYSITDPSWELGSSPQLRVKPHSNSRLDTISFAYGYVRNTEFNTFPDGSSSPVFDTLIVYWLTSEQLVKVTLNNGRSVALPKSNIWDKDKFEPSFYAHRQAFLLDNSVSTTVSNNNGGFENSWSLAIQDIPVPANIISDSTDTDKLFGYMIQFRSGVIGGDNGYMIYQRSPSTLPPGSIRPNYYLFYARSEQNESDWGWLNSGISNHITALGDYAYPNPNGARIMSGSMFVQKRVITDYMHVTSREPSDNFYIRTNNTHESCNTPASGRITVVTTGGTPPYQYALNNGSYQSSNEFNNLTSGRYTVYVKDAGDNVRVAKTNVDFFKSGFAGSILGPKNVQPGSESNYQAYRSSTNIEWQVDGGVMLGSNLSTNIRIRWDNNITVGKVYLISDPRSSCADTTILQVNLSPQANIGEILTNNVFVYPNPTSDFVNIEGLDYRNVNLTIFNVNGQQVLSKQIINEDSSKIDISELPNGYYFMQLNSVSYNKTIKLVKINK